MNNKDMPANRYEKEQAVYNIRGYYNLQPEIAARNTPEKEFARAKAEYISTLKRQLQIAESTSILDAFPKAALAELERRG